jgi:hypothetical protein
MTNALVAPYLYADDIVPVSASGTSTITKGDWVIASAQWAIAAHDATIGSPAYKLSALGFAMQQNPTYDDQGVAVNNTGLQVATRGVFRVSGGNSGTAYTIPVGSFCYPNTSASGIVGQTGATGVGPIWNTAAPVDGSGATGATPSGVAVVLSQHGGGDITGVQMDIRLNLATNLGYF